MFSIIDIVLMTIFFIYNALMMRRLSILGAKVKRALRFFPDDVIMKDRNVLAHISLTSNSSGYGTLLRRKTVFN